MSRIHLVAPASPLNKGDAAIYVGAVNLIKQYLPSSELSISVEGYGRSGNVLRMFDPSTIKLQKGLFQGIKDSLFKGSGTSRSAGEHSLSDRIRSQFSFPRFFHIPFMLAQINKFAKLEPEPFDSIRDSEVVVILGHNLEESSLNMFLLNYAVPKLLYKRKTIIFPISISAFDNDENLTSNIRELYTKFVLKQMDFIMLRESLSFEFLKTRLHIDGNIALVADTAFFLPKESFHNVETEKPALAVCMRGEGYFQEYGKHVHVSYSSFNRTLAKALDSLIERLAVNVYFVPMTIYPSLDSDKYDFDGALRVLAEMKQRKKAHMINTWDMTPGEIAYLLEHMDFVLTMRLHQAIIAATVGTPSALVLPPRDNKGPGVMRSLGLDDYFIDLGLPSNKMYESIVAKVKDGLDIRTDLKRMLDSRLLSIRKEAAAATRILALTIEEYERTTQIIA